MFGAIINGFGFIGRRPGLVVLLYLINLVAALLCVAPLWVVLRSVTRDGVYGNLEQVSFLADLVRWHGTGLAPVGLIMILVAIGVMVLGQFSSMGVFCVMHNRKGPFMATFLGGIGVWFWPVVRLLALCSPLFICCVLLPKLTLPLLAYLVPDPASYHETIVALLSMGVGLFVLGRVLDYARLHALSRGNRRMSLALWRGLKFVVRYGYAAWPLALFFAVLTAAVTYGYGILVQRPEMIGLGLVLAQAHMLLRMTFRVAMYGGEWALYDHCQPTAPRLIQDGQPPVRRDGNFWEKDKDLEKQLVHGSPETGPDAPKAYTLD